VVTQLLPGPKRQTVDYDALRMLDAVWGGSGTRTRLFLNLREQKGYSYGVYSFTTLFEQAGMWYANGGVQTNKTKESIVEFDREMKGLAGARPITEEEFIATRNRRVRGYFQQFESYARVSGLITDLWADHLPTNEFQREYDAATKLSLADVVAAAKKYAHPERATLLLVGDRRKIEPGLKELNLGEIVILDDEGRPVAGAGR
jgi:zinc protease